MTGEKKKAKKARRGNRGKGSKYVRDTLRKLDQKVKTAGLRKKSRQERSTEPDGPVERILVPALPHRKRDGRLGVSPDVGDYYQAIGPLEHPYMRLALVRGKERPVAKTELECGEGCVRLCLVVGYLTQVEPKFGGGIKLGHGEYIDYSDVKHDLGYHQLKREEAYLETFRAAPNYVHYMRVDYWAGNCKLVADPDNNKVVWVKPCRYIRADDELILRPDSAFFPAEQKEEEKE